MLNKNRHMGINYLLWLIVAIFYGLDYLQHTISSVLLLPLAQSLNVSYVTIANIMNVYFPIYAFAQIPAGHLMDRFGLARTLSVAAALTGMGLLIMITPSLKLILIGRTLVAIGSAFAFIGGLKAASCYLPDKIFPFMVGLLQSIGVIGGLLGQVWINQLIEKIGWQHAVFSIAIFGLIWACVMLLLPQQTNHNSPKIQPCASAFIKKISTIASNLSLWYLGIYATLMVGTVMSTFAETYGVVILETIKHVGSEHAAWLNSIIFIGVASGAPTHGLIANAFNKKTTWLRLCTVATTLVFLSIPLYLQTQFNINKIIILYFLLGFFVSSMLLSFSIVKEIINENEQATAFAFINTMIGLGGFFIPLLFGEIIHIQSKDSQTHGLMVAASVLSLPLLLAAVIAFRIHKKS